METRFAEEENLEVAELFDGLFNWHPEEESTYATPNQSEIVMNLLVLPWVP